jgi:hypothetical protein
MFYSFGPQYSYNLLYTVAKRFFTRAPSELELADFQGAYQRWIASVQPSSPAPTQLGVELLDDPEREERLLRPLLEPSILDDREQYKDLAKFKTVQRDRELVAREAGHVRGLIESFAVRNSEFWEIFAIYTNYIVFCDSKFSPGGTSSGALGTIFCSRSLELDADSLYELLVHEVTHLMMFVDERRSRHYRDDQALATPENFAVSAVYQKRRPLDKVLHSIVVSTEVLLHREHVIGHGSESTVHPSTEVLAPATLRSCASILELQGQRQLLAPRGVQLVETCASLLRPLAEPRTIIAVAS